MILGFVNLIIQTLNGEIFARQNIYTLINDAQTRAMATHITPLGPFKPFELSQSQQALATGEQ